MQPTLCQVSLALRNTMNGNCWCPIRSLVRIGPFAFYRPDPKHAAHAIRAPGTSLLISQINTPIPAYFQTPISAGLSILHSALLTRLHQHWNHRILHCWEYSHSGSLLAVQAACCDQRRFLAVPWSASQITRGKFVAGPDNPKVMRLTSFCTWKLNCNHQTLCAPNSVGSDIPRLVRVRVA